MAVFHITFLGCNCANCANPPRGVPGIVVFLIGAGTGAAFGCAAAPPDMMSPPPAAIIAAAVTGAATTAEIATGAAHAAARIAFCVGSCLAHPLCSAPHTSQGLYPGVGVNNCIGAGICGCGSYFLRMRGKLNGS